MCGIVFAKTPAFYDYNFRICANFVERVCFSDKNVFLIFLERTAGSAFLLLLLHAAGIHPVGLAVPPIALIFRGYTFGGMLTLLFSVYGMTGALICFTICLPVHLLLDLVFLCASSLSCFRAFRFSFCGDDFKELLSDFLFFLALVALICLIEMLLLLTLFHPIGNLV